MEMRSWFLLDWYALGRCEYLIGHVTGVEYTFRFETKNFCLFIGAGPMFDSARNHNTFSRAH